MVDIVDLDAAKLLVEFDAAVDREDLLEIAQLAGNRMVRTYLGWDPVLHEGTDVLSGYGAPAIALKRLAVQSLSSVQIGGVESPISNFTFDGRMLLHKAGVFPRALFNVRVTYRAGYQQLPEELVLATNIAIKAAWGALALDPNFASHNIPGVESAVIQAAGAGALPPGARSMIAHLRVLFLS